MNITSGEHVDFIWDEGNNIVKVNKEVYEDCSDLKLKAVNTTATSGPFIFEADLFGVGDHYFICGVGGHCKFGNQKAKITVGNC